MPKFLENINLSEFSNYKIGGPARFFFEAKNVEEIAWATQEAKRKGLAVFVLGGGTNLLIGDEGFEGLVLKPSLNFLEVEGETIRAGAGAKMADVLDVSAKAGLGGLEWAGGLPGTLGGAIRGNAGCFGGETKDVVSSVESFDAETGKTITRTNQECNFSYRTSIFKEDGPSRRSRQAGEIILSAVLALKKGDASRVAKAIQEKIDYRLSRHPMENPNIGSIFKNVSLARINADVTQIDADTIRVHLRSNPRTSAFTVPVKIDPFPVIPAAYLISEAGLKGVSSGGAMVSPKHPNFIVNVLEAKASDVKSLIGLVKSEVKSKFGLELEEEVMEV